MNPESIQGHADSNTGAGSSYDLLSFRLPLGNELEYNWCIRKWQIFGCKMKIMALQDNVGVLLFGGIVSFAGGGNAGFRHVHPSFS